MPVIAPQIVPEFRRCHPLDRHMFQPTVTDELPVRLVHDREKTIAIAFLVPQIPPHPPLHPRAVERADRECSHDEGIGENAQERVGVLRSHGT